MFRLIFNSGVPSDIIPREAIKYDEPNHRIIIDLWKINIPFQKKPYVWMPMIPSTGSMKPTFGAGNNNILIAPADSADAKIMTDWLAVETRKGYDNVVVYKRGFWSVIHRAIKVGKDRLGRYFKLRGDKNLMADPYRIRDSAITHISIGSIY